jgi:hypothetical protein
VCNPRRLLVDRPARPAKWFKLLELAVPPRATDGWISRWVGVGNSRTYAGSGKTDPGRNESLSYRYIGGWREAEELDFSVVAGAGAIVSTTADMATFIQGLFDLKLVSKESLVHSHAAPLTPLASPCVTGTSGVRTGSAPAPAAKTYAAHSFGTLWTDRTITAGFRKTRYAA